LLLVGVLVELELVLDLVLMVEVVLVVL